MDNRNKIHRLNDVHNVPRDIEFKWFGSGVETRQTCQPADCSRVSTGTILVIDDEEIIRTLLSEMLKELGFDVLTAQDGTEGVSVYVTSIDCSP